MIFWIKVLKKTTSNSNSWVLNSNPYNPIRHTVSFLPRSTQESGLSRKKEKEEKKLNKSHKVKTAGNSSESEWEPNS